ncbi:MAG: CvpA family protein [Chloroflexota bacterium]|nr:CvpA family protein [Chloroflexota bacterium]MDE2883916.1 CvpA family protein [Chloroflexota bacterium]
MNLIDLLILFLLVAGGFLGWVNGVIKWLFTFLGFIVGLFLASRLYDTLDWAIPMVDSDGLRQFITFVVILAAVVVGAWVLGRAIKATLSILMLGWVDRGVGMAVGLLVGLLGASALVLAMDAIPVEEVQEALRESLVADILLDGTSFLRGLMPAEFDIRTSLFADPGEA